MSRLVVIPVATRAVRARNRNNPTIETATKTSLRMAMIGFATLAGTIAAGYGRMLSESAVVIAALAFVLGIAGQQAFGSLVSGMFLVADPEFNVGDWIEWPGGSGTVEAVDFRVTRIRTPDHEAISVPNTELTTNAITRPYGRDRFRLTEQVDVAYDEDTERALLELRQIAATLDPVLEEPPTTTRIAGLGENAIAIRAESWTDDPGNKHVQTIRADFRRLVKRRFDAAGTTLAPPSAQLLSGPVSVSDGTEESPTADDSPDADDSRDASE